MMSAQMLAAATNTAEAAAASQDSMKMLDAEAEEPRQPVVFFFRIVYEFLSFLKLLLSFAAGR